jgi:hypothetical protein
MSQRADGVRGYQLRQDDDDIIAVCHVIRDWANGGRLRPWRTAVRGRTKSSVARTSLRGSLLRALPVECCAEIDSAHDGARLDSHAWSIQRLTINSNRTSLRPRPIRIALKVCTIQLEIGYRLHCWPR